MAGGNVPPQLAAIFSAAGKANNIPANVLAGIASVESNLGQNSGPSSAGAIGMMQFLPSTARSIGVNPNDPRSAIFGAAKLLNQYGYQQNPTRAIGAYNGGPGNPQYGYAQQVLSEAKRLGGQVASGGAAVANPRQATSSPLSLGAPQTVTQQSFDQAGYNQALGKFIAGEAVKQSGGSSNPFNVTRGTSKGFSSTLASGVGPNPLFSKGLLTTTAPNAQDFVSTKTIQVAQNALQGLAGSTPLNVHPGAVPGYKGYVNPLPGFSIGRTDMGVDANARPGAPIRAIGDSRVVAIRPNWYQGQPYLQLQLLNGPKKGQFYYVAEQINPQVKPGQVVHAGDPIATYASQGTGIEIGWGTPGWQTLAQAQGNTGDASHGNSPAGVDFRQFLGGLK